MTSLRLLLLSGSREGTTGYLEHAKNMLKNFLGYEIKTLLFIPYAGLRLSYDDYENKVSNPFKDIGYVIKSIHNYTNKIDAIQSADAIVVGGGNTFALLNQLYSDNLIDAIRKKVLSGTPYIGWSAGSNIAGPSIRTTNDMPIIEPPSFSALHLVDFQINPHYITGKIPGHNGESREERLEEFLIVNPETTIAALPEGSAISIIGNTIKALGSKPLTIHSSALKKKTFHPEDHCGKAFLLRPTT